MENPAWKRITLVVALVILMTIAFGVVVWNATRRTVSNVVTAVTTPEETTIDLGALVTQVRELNRLETAAMRVMHVSTTTQGYKMVPDALGGDEITFLATGDVIAGIDLSQIREDDVWRDGDGTIVMRLPPPQVLVTRLDNKESKVISRKTGVLRRADVDLESRVRQTAEQGIRNEAVRKGLLPLASDNAEKKLGDFIHTLGAKRVRFVSSGVQAPRPQL